MTRRLPRRTRGLRLMSSAVVHDRTIEAMAPRHWYRADTYTLSGGNLATLPNRGSAGGQLAVASGTIAAPATDATLGGAQSFALTGTQWADSNLPASEFRFLHDGTGFDTFVVLVPTGTGTRTVWATRALSAGAEIGSHLLVNNATFTGGVQVCNGTTIILQGATAPATQNAAAYFEAAYTEVAAPEGFCGFKETVSSVGDTTGAPSSADPQGTFRLGAGVAGAAPGHARIADLLIFNRRLTPYERQLVREYIAARYGIAAPVWTAEDRAILQLNPFSWIRADYYSTSGGKVTAFLDKVLPGHSMAQGTSANQVVDPVVDANFNGQLAATFDAVTGHRYVSSLPASTWGFCHNGTGMTVTSTVRLTNVSYILSTKTQTSAQVGFRLQTGSLANGRFNFSVGNASAFILSLAHGLPSIFDTTAYALATYQEGLSPEAVISASGGRSSTSGSSSDVPSASAPFTTLNLGGQPGAILTGQWAESILFNRVLSSSEQALYAAYQSRYGL